MKKITSKYLSRYVKHLFGVDVTFKIVKRVRLNGYEYGAYEQSWEYPDGRREHKIIITESTLENGVPQWLIWHEVGHAICGGKNYTDSEYNAERFALEQANKRGYYKILQKMVEWIDNWKYRKETRYRKVRKMLLGIE